MSHYSGMELGDELLDNTLEGYGKQRNYNNRYSLESASNGVKITEYDDEDNILSTHVTNESVKITENDFSDVELELTRRKEVNTKIKMLRYSLILISIFIILLSFLIVFIGKGGV